MTGGLNTMTNAEAKNFIRQRGEYTATSVIKTTQAVPASHHPGGVVHVDVGSPVRQLTV